MRRWSRALLGAMLIQGLLVIAPSTAPAASAGVTGPVTGGAFGVPQSAWVATDLAAVGFVEEEFFFDGVATAYAPAAGAVWSSDGIWPAVETTSAAFRTRMLVRRPADSASFNGTVIVEWLNVTAGFDTSPTWAQGYDEIIRGGYAYIGLTAQKVGANALLGDPGRYATINHPGDAYSYDILSQAGQALRSGPTRVLLPGMTVNKIIAAGESQSASRMVTYINAVHPLARAFNGFLIYSRGSGASAIADGVVMPTRPIVRTDTPGRIVDVQTEGDIVVLRSHLARQDDNGRFRLWEVAGGSHADEHTLSVKNPPTPSVAGSPCEFRMNSVRTHMVIANAVRALHLWTNKIASPTRAARMALGADENAIDPVLRDADGLGIGGLRLPQMDVPIATVDGLANPAAAGAPPLFQSFCRLFGRTQDFTDAELDARYPTHVGYVLVFYVYAVQARDAGFLLPEDARQLIGEAMLAPVGADV
jgi:hypothetical protein